MALQATYDLVLLPSILNTQYVSRCSWTAGIQTMCIQFQLPSCLLCQQPDVVTRHFLPNFVSMTLWIYFATWHSMSDGNRPPSWLLLRYIWAYASSLQCVKWTSFYWTVPCLWMPVALWDILKPQTHGLFHRITAWHRRRHAQNLSYWCHRSVKNLMFVRVYLLGNMYLCLDLDSEDCNKLRGNRI